ncbi:hypothetical protein SeMB42_g06922 [Synchytrium endobioticum]|uniref:SET domain-containing protein n=1 Tax=Synchytrium endobioticum TaxID=286115 RepID=A0A507CDU6_9FUNG|nr:hypothetical protein SeMB42_g06922 [Synchytrium endobioticum]
MAPVASTPPDLIAHLSIHNLGLSPSASKHRILVSTTPLRAGDIILNDTALCTSSTSLHACHACLKPSSRLALCSRCSISRYCCRPCQRRDWKLGHNILCTLLASASLDRHDYGEADLLIKTLVNAALPSPGLESAAFNSLMDHPAAFDAPTQSQISHTAATVLAHPAMTAILASHPSPLDLACTYIRRFKSNNYVIHDPDLNVTGEGCFALAALLNHSCCPNVSVAFQDGRTMVLRAMSDVMQGDELLVAYQDSMTCRSRRREYLHSKYHFECTCPRCQTPPSIIPSVHGGYPYIDALLTDSEDPIDIQVASRLLREATDQPKYSRLFTTSKNHPSLLQYIANIVAVLVPCIDEPQSKYLIRHHNVITTSLNKPNRLHTLPYFVSLSRLLTNQLDSQHPVWLHVAYLALYAACTYLLAYERYHPMVGLKFVLAAKALFNAADAATTHSELRNMVLDAKECIKVGKVCLQVSHGRHGDNDATKDSQSRPAAN